MTSSSGRCPPRLPIHIAATPEELSSQSGVAAIQPGRTTRCCESPACAESKLRNAVLVDAQGPKRNTKDAEKFAGLESFWFKLLDAEAQITVDMLDERRLSRASEAQNDQ